jgi:hypothetical protein
VCAILNAKNTEEDEKEFLIYARVKERKRMKKCRLS